MKNKSKKIILISLAILLVVLIQIIGVTYAKYISSDETTGSAEVAQWSFKLAKEGETTKTLKLVDTTNKDTLINGKIAPGTSGRIVLELDATGSDVDMDYAVKFLNEENKPRNLKFIYNDTSAQQLADLIGIKGTIEYNAGTKIVPIVIEWEWLYETVTPSHDIDANDIIDTEDAQAMQQYTFDVVVTATQSEEK